MGNCNLIKKSTKILICISLILNGIFLFSIIFLPDNFYHSLLCLSVSFLLNIILYYQKGKASKLASDICLFISGGASVHIAMWLHSYLKVDFFILFFVFELTLAIISASLKTIKQYKISD